VGFGQDALSCLGCRLEKFASAIKPEPVDGVICIRAEQAAAATEFRSKGCRDDPPQDRALMV